MQAVGGSRFRRVIRRAERLLLGAVMSLAAFIIERRVLRAVRRRGGSAPPPPPLEGVTEVTREG